MEYREFRAESVSADDQGVIEGLVTPFDTKTVIGDLDHGGWREEVAPGTFAKTLAEGDALMVYQHDLTKPLARVSAGNLDLREGSYEGQKGLAVKATPVDTSYARDLKALVKAKVIRGMSFGFNVTKDDWYDDQGRASDEVNGTNRVIREVKLIEVSPVTRPAYASTAIAARDESSVLLERRAAKATYADLETCADCGATGQYGAYCSGCGAAMKTPKPAGDFCTACGAELDDGTRAAHRCDDLLDDAALLLTLYNRLNDEGREAVCTELEARSAAVSQKDRDKLAAKNHALPDGSYPIPDLAHLHAAAILAASHHGDWKAAQELIRKRAVELGVAPESLPGLNEKKAADETQTLRDERSQEPDASTPDPEDDLALRMSWRVIQERSRELGF